MTPSSPGTLLAGRYRLGEVLGRGGMGVVRRARDELLDRDVAVKEVSFSEGLPDDERAALEERLLREARAGARVAHPNAVTVHDVTHAEGRSYLVMELVDAPTLEELVRADGPLLPAEAARVGLGILDVLQAAHAVEVVHRDVKPANVLVSADGRVKLTDFGIATAVIDPRMTATGMVLGSPSYLAPELAQAGEVTPGADTWGLGATLFFAVTGQAPFDRGEGAVASLLAAAREPLVLPEEAGELGPVIAAMLAKTSAERPDDDALRQLLEPVGAGASVAGLAGAVPTPAPTVAYAPVPTAMHATTAVPPAIGGPEIERVYDDGPRQRWLLPVLGTLAALLVGFGAYSLAQDDDPPADRLAVGSGPSATPSAEDAPSARPSAKASVSRAPSAASTQGSVAGVGVTLGEGERYRSPEGWTITVPSGWTVSRNRFGTDISDPSSADVLRVAFTDEPGDDPKAAWEEQERSFRKDHAGYERIRLEDASYRDYDAAEWEFRYDAGGTQVHALDLGFVTDDKGFALLWKTSDGRWDSSFPRFEAFKDSFQPSGS